MKIPIRKAKNIQQALERESDLYFIKNGGMEPIDIIVKQDEETMFWMWAGVIAIGLKGKIAECEKCGGKYIVLENKYAWEKFLTGGN